MSKYETLERNARKSIYTYVNFIITETANSTISCRGEAIKP